MRECALKYRAGEVIEVSSSERRFALVQRSWSYGYTGTGASLTAIHTAMLQMLCLPQRRTLTGAVLRNYHARCRYNQGCRPT